MLFPDHCLLEPFLKDLSFNSFAITAAGVVPCDGPQKPTRTLSIVQNIFSFGYFEIREGILRNQSENAYLYRFIF